MAVGDLELKKPLTFISKNGNIIKSPRDTATKTINKIQLLNILLNDFNKGV